MRKTSRKKSKQSANEKNIAQMRKTKRKWEKHILGISKEIPKKENHIVNR